MAELSADIVVVGAGVLGLCTAVELAARGHDVRVVDPGEPNASSVAAGMIAPAAEVLLDALGNDVAELFRDAAALWPGLAERAGVWLDQTPAEWRADDADAVAAQLIAKGFAPHRCAGGLELPSDIRLDPGQALAALSCSTGAPLLPGRLLSLEATAQGWRMILSDGEMLTRTLVLANGVAPAVPGTPPSVTRLLENVFPIAGQIGRLGARLTDRVVRGGAGYVVPAADDTTLIGATMVAHERSPRPDPAASRILLASAESLLGCRIVEPVDWRVGVRGASPDGLPMAGSTGVAGLHLALAPRRNGWLLGPLVGQVVADGIEGRPRDRFAAAFDPIRFSRVR